MQVFQQRSSALRDKQTRRLEFKGVSFSIISGRWWRQDKDTTNLYATSPRCRRRPPPHTTMASDVNITPTSSITSPRWLWGGPSPRRADGTPIINSQQKDIKYDTTRLISLIFLRYYGLHYSPHRCCIIGISFSYLLLIQYPSFLSGEVIALKIHTQPRTATVRCRPGVTSIKQLPCETQEVSVIIWFVLHLPHTENKSPSDLLRRHWIVISPLEIFDRVGFLGYGYYFRFWFLLAQLAYKKRVNPTNTESYALFGIDEVYILFPMGVDIVM